MTTYPEPGFRAGMKRDLDAFVLAQRSRFPQDETLVIDLHCHDRNSDVPDELLGRILRWPETWATSDEVRSVLARNGTTALTLTNHNNARSCYELLDRGIDTLVGAEFTCTVPDFDAQVHVLTYDFTPAQESRLFALRGDLYRFLGYAREQDLVTVLAHPLYFYSARHVPPLALLEKLTLLFDTFEVLNGQRDSWQNLLVIAWLQSLSELRIAEMSKRAGIRADAFCRRPVKKAMTGGSDDHMALFVGTTGSRVHVPNLARRLEREPPSALVLEALKRGSVAPYGAYTGEEKLAASFLDYFCQIARNAEDPGLVRLLLHQGTARQKIWAFLIANGMYELRRHRYTSKFIEAAHEALHGKPIGVMRRYAFSKEYRPLAKQLDRIAKARDEDPGRFEEELRTALPALFHEVSAILARRVEGKVERFKKERRDEPPLSLQALIERLEVPSNLRTLFGGADEGHTRSGMSAMNLPSLFEGLPFPALAAMVIGGSTYTSTKVLFANRPLLDEFSQSICRYRHPRRMLWLTDTFFDKNGVAGVLRQIHAEAVRRNLPIDFAICHPDATPDAHLKVLRPVAEIALPFYEQQPLRVFDVLELQRLFIDGAYDRVLCSTEGLMGLAAQVLKNAFSVPAYFYVHTDWIDFARSTLKLDAHNTDRVRRLLRAFYRSFDGLFALNSEHVEWLASDAMGIPRGRLRRTAHWVDERFGPHRVRKSEVFPGLRDDEPLLLFVGRISEEKGVMDLPQILADVRREVPGARLAVVGSGPAEERLRAAVPDALLRSWLPAEELARIYPAVDVLLLPSRFDTFGCVVLEALASGLPVVAYRSKGPKDIIEDGLCGYTVNEAPQMAEAAARILRDPSLRARLGARAIERASHYRADRIVDELLRDVGLAASNHSLDDEAPMPREVSEWDHLLSAPSTEVAGRRLA